MPIKQDFLAYHKSISEELKSSENRIRHLIGGSHWLTDGEHKESVLRNVLTEFAPEIFRIGTGFVCCPSSEDERKNTGQIDILITSKIMPTLYKKDKLNFVTPECTKAIIEVKTKISNEEKLKEFLNKISDDIEFIRKHTGQRDFCWASLFIYKNGLESKRFLEVLQEVTNKNHDRVINCISIGENDFIRFWPKGHPEGNIGEDPVWHLYELTGLSQSYFISNIISHLSNFDETSAKAWFPIEGTKEVHKRYYAKMNENTVEMFN